MKAGIRQSASWLHCWGGLVLGWLCFAIFFTGTLAYYRPEISQWMRPELGNMHPLDVHALDRIARHLPAYPDAKMWQFNLPDARHPEIRVFYTDAQGAYHHQLYDPASGEALHPRETEGGDLFYRFHFELMLPSLIGRIVAGICAMFMLVAIVSGIITHRRFFRDFFTFRPFAHPQRAWLDGHNILGVIGLPFHIIIVYSGLITLMFLYFPWGALWSYHGNQSAFFADAYDAPPAHSAKGASAVMVPFYAVLSTVRLENPHFSAGRIVVQNPGDQAATIAVFALDTSGLSARPDVLVFDAISGNEIFRNLEPSAIRESWNVLYGLHMGRFAEPVFRFVLFLLGVAGTGVVGTGLVLWSVKREKSVYFGAGRGLVHVLNVASLAGFPFACGVYFLANRLLPVGGAQRASWEVASFYAAIILCALFAILRSRRAVWRDIFALTSACFGVLPIVGAATGLPGMFYSGGQTSTVLVIGDGVMMAVALCFAILALRVSRQSHRQGKPAC